MLESNKKPETSEDEYTLCLAKLLLHNQQIPTIDNEPIDIGMKLTNENYPLWAVHMKRELGGKGLTSHVTGVPKPLPNTDPTFPFWEKADHKVYSWISKNLNPSLVKACSQYPTSKELWDGLAIMFGSTSDALQVYDLYRRANNIKQNGELIDSLWGRLQEICMAIDRREPNPMRHTEDINIYNEIIQTHRLFDYIMALDERYDAVKKGIPKTKPLPSVTSAYAMVRQDTVDEQIIKPSNTHTTVPQEGIGSGLTTKGATTDNIGSGLAMRDRGRPGQCHRQIALTGIGDPTKIRAN